MNENVDKQFFVSVEFQIICAVKDRRYKGENEVAQPVASVRVSPRLRGSGRHLFSTLGHSNKWKCFFFFFFSLRRHIVGVVG